jgi:dihydroneopterin aldolase
VYSIHLNDLAFRAPVGVFAEEKKLGTDIVINVAVSVNQLPEDAKQYLDYAAIFQLVRKSAAQPVDLLEELSLSIIQGLFIRFPDIHKIDVRIRKIHPPILGCRGSVEVCISQNRS